MTKNREFSLVVDTKNGFNEKTVEFYIEGILDHAKKLGLTISGNDLPLVRRGIDHIRKGNLLSVGTSGTHDVDWIERREFARERSLNPVFDLVEDYRAILDRMTKFAEARAIRTLNGTKVEFYPGFVKIGREIIPNEKFAKIVAKLKY